VRSVREILRISLIEGMLGRPRRQRTAALNALSGAALVAAAFLRTRAALNAEITGRTGIGRAVRHEVGKRIFLAYETGELGERVFRAADTGRRRRRRLRLPDGPWGPESTLVGH
jgi:hypothetical protein